MSPHPSGIHSDPEILSGTPVFVETRVAARALIDQRPGGHPLDEFLDDFPSVSREQAIAALELAREAFLRAAAAWAPSRDLPGPPCRWTRDVMPSNHSPGPPCMVTTRIAR
jgi:uncharacterized protein (DUF433 family)